MSTVLSLTYLKTTASISEVFDAVVTSFHDKLDGKLYTLDGTITQPAIVEQYSDSARARLIIDSCHLDFFNRGVTLFPKSNGLYVITDTVTTSVDTYIGGRIRRAEEALELEQSKDPKDNWRRSLFLFIDFLRYLTRSINAEAAHIMFERNPAGNGTSVHFYDNGLFVDSYYFEDVECIGELGPIDLPEHPDIIRKILDGRFGFLLGIPGTRRYEDGTVGRVYFSGHNLGPYHHDTSWDVLGVTSARLNVPFWETEMPLPFGTVYSLEHEFPDSFLAHYQSQ